MIATSSYPELALEKACEPFAVHIGIWDRWLRSSTISTRAWRAEPRCPADVSSKSEGSSLLVNLDENLGERGRQRLCDAGLAVATVGIWDAIV